MIGACRNCGSIGRDGDGLRLHRQRVRWRGADHAEYGEEHRENE
jgi:hypothetical protein